jgi:predicted acetyltransferase
MKDSTTHTVAFPPLLEVPAPAFMPSYIEALKEGFVRGDELPMTPEEIEPIEENPTSYIERLLGPQSPLVTLPDGTQVPRVPATLLWLVEGNSFIGAVNIRHQLNEHLEKYGGHIGYGVRPSQRGGGYGRLILKLALRYAKNNLGLNKVLLTCDDSNIGSRRVIEYNQGELFDRRPHPFKKGALSLRYWVPT